MSPDDILPLVLLTFAGLLVVVGVLLGLMRITDVIHRRRVRRWQVRDAEESAGTFDAYTQALLEGTLSPEEVRRPSAGKLRNDGLRLQWNSRGIVLRERSHREGDSNTDQPSIQLSHAEEKGLPDWWSDENPPTHWLGVTLRLSGDRWHWRAPWPRQWPLAVLPTLDNDGEVTNLPALLALVEATAFHQLPIGRHAPSEQPAAPAQYPKHEVARSQIIKGALVWGLLWAAPIIGALAFAHTRGAPLTALVMPFGLVACGYALFLAATDLYCRRLVYIGLWQNVGHDHPDTWSRWLTHLWGAVGYGVFATAWLGYTRLTIIATGLGLALAVVVSDQLLMPRRFGPGRARRPRQSPHRQRERAARRESGAGNKTNIKVRPKGTPFSVYVPILVGYLTAAGGWLVGMEWMQPTSVELVHTSPDRVSPVTLAFYGFCIGWAIAQSVVVGARIRARHAHQPHPTPGS